MTKDTPRNSELAPLDGNTRLRYAVQDGHLLLAIPMPKGKADIDALPRSKPKPGQTVGQNHIVATSHGFATIPGTNVRVSLNIIVPPTA